MASTQTITAEDLLRMKGQERYELMRGELRKMSPPGIRHGKIVGNFFGPLREYVNSHKLGAAFVGDPGFLLARKPDIVLAPDAAFIRAERLAGGEPAGYWEGAPDLAVEVVSPGDTVYEVEEKTDDWISLGCRMVVVVSDRKRTVTVHRPGQQSRILRGDDVFDGEDVVPGFRLPLSEIFA